VTGRARAAGGVLLVLLSAATVAVSSSRLEKARESTRLAAQVLYLPSGKYLQVASLGFSSLLADIIYIWSIQYYGNFDAEDRFQYLEHIYGNVISELDPHYIDPYLIGSIIMNVEAKDPEMSLRLLDKGAAANPGEWIFPFEAGFTCYHDLKDYPRAARYLDKAVAIPGVPNVVKRLHAEMFNKMGDKRSSLAYWREVLTQAEDDYVRDIAGRHVHDLQIEVDVEALDAAIARYREARGANPPALSALVRAGLIRRVPDDPDGNPYAYDPASGRVRSTSRFRLLHGASR